MRKLLMLLGIILIATTSCKKVKKNVSTETREVYQIDEKVIVEWRITEINQNAYKIQFVAVSKYTFSKKFDLTYEEASYETYGFNNPVRKEITLKNIKVKRGETLLFETTSPWDDMFKFKMLKKS